MAISKVLFYTNVMYVCYPFTDLVMLGVGYHHAGVDVSDRKMVEEAFTRGDLPVLCEKDSLVHTCIMPCIQNRCKVGNILVGL